ncbi:MAG: hypothetical protein AAB400_03685 [Patescibacteria group bacterium]
MLLRKKKFFLAIIILTLFASIDARNVFAQVLSSTNYRVLSSSINCGGNTATSASYALQDSTCETVGPGASDSNAVFTISTNYSLGGGYQAMTDIPTLSVTLSASSISFGTLSTASVTTATPTVDVTVTTNAVGGYSATIIADGAFRSAGGNFGDVTDGTVTAGQNEYGVRTSGTDGQFNDTDTCIPYTGSGCSTTPKTVATNSSWVSSKTTTLSFKASPSGTTAAGNYSQSITVIISGTF